MRDARILDYLSSRAWALEPGVFDRMVQVVLRHAQGTAVAQEDIDAIVAARDARDRGAPSAYVNVGGVGVVPITGVIARHARQVNGSSQPRGTSVEQIRNDLAAALADPEAHSVMLAIDSPGGSVDGLVEIADEIRAARDAKPLVAHVAGLGASAAYWIASQASRIYATRASEVGSIGVITPVIDNHRAFETDGVDVRWVTSAPAKVAGAPGKQHSLSDLSEIQAGVDEWHEMFVAAVASGRGITEERARELADGRVHFAPKAQELGLIDGVATEAALLKVLAKEARAARRNENKAESTRTDLAATTTEEETTMGKQLEGAGAVPAAEAPAVPPAGGPTVDPTAIAREAVARERQRITSIQALGKGVDAQLVQAAVDEGISAGDAAIRFCAWHQEHRAGALAAMRTDMAADKRAAGTDDPDRVVDGKAKEPAKPALTGEAKWRDEFATNAAIAAEFGDVETYVAFKQNDGRPAAAFANPRRMPRED